MKRDKWFFLTTQVGHDRYTVPIYEASARNKCVPLLKTLMSSFCSNNCAFCAFRCERRTRRLRWKPEELTNVTMKLWKEGKIKGLFLSSSVEKDPESTMEMELETVELLRRKGFKAYIHLRCMPGCSLEMIKRSVELADRVGINVEFPTKEYFNEMKIHLDFGQDVIRRIRWIAREVEKAKKQGKCKAGLDSQLIVGASNESDKEILKITEWLYKELKASRVYYSAFEPIKDTPLENKRAENPWREYRLYQASFLIRDYGYTLGDFVFNDNGNLPLHVDPKIIIAKKIINEPIDVNEASFEKLIRIPGIGPKTARRIMELRKVKRLDIKSLRQAGVIVKRALPFIKLEKHAITKNLLSYTILRTKKRCNIYLQTLQTKT